MVYLTGDIHGDPRRLLAFSDRIPVREEDVIVLLGDVGANYYGGKRDEQVKTWLSMLPCSVLCIHGNHEKRPQTIPTYHEELWRGGICFVEDAYPNLKFAKDGEIFDLEGKRCIAIGGAYSVDKAWRIAGHYGWWEDEQPSAEIKTRVEQQLEAHPIDVVFSHTCPYPYEPCEKFLPSVDQSTVDTSTEHWLDHIEQRISYEAWYCGHWHVDKRIRKIHFLFQSWEVLGGQWPSFV